MSINKTTLLLLNDKKKLEIIGLKNWYTKKHFGHRVAHHLDTYNVLSRTNNN